MRPHSTEPLQAGDTIAGYEIVREIGHGGFGIVYEAFNPVIEDRAAIKQFMPRGLGSFRQGTMVIQDDDNWELHQKILERFEEEARLQSKFSHPNILKVKNFIRADNTGYMVADYIEGTTLAQFLNQYGKVFPSEEMFRSLMEPIAEAIAYAHERFALHRDISPDNIMIDKDLKPILVDFGAAKRDLRRSPTYSSIIPYRELYAPVEQRQPAAERPEGYYTDIFAFAGTMYHLLAGEAPVGPLDRALSQKDPYIPLAQKAKTKCSEAVCRAIDQALALAPASRPQTVHNFMELLGWRASQPVSPAIQVLTPVADPPERPPGGSGRALGYLAVATLVVGVATGLYYSNTSTPPPFGSFSTPTPSPTPSPVISRPTPTNVVTPTPPTITPRSTSTATPTSIPTSTSSTTFPPVVVPTTRPTTPPPPTYTTFENRDIEGGDLPGQLPHFRDVDQIFCQNQCSLNSQCVGYSFGKWDRACYLKGSLPNLRFEPNSTGVIRSNQVRPPDYLGSLKIDATRRNYVGNRYSTSTTPTRKACEDTCLRESPCLGYQYVAGSCWRYDRIDFATKDDSALAGVKRQPAPDAR
ncbi:protein kinase [Bradyrhizobium sp. 180]|uniref:protein kinase domain-containing protein n=1 Tax=Bradyrhizobium sp. 180 TaxID=2782650 RepID=UPI001FFA9BF4|nr:protein kinase [Bradyrhizobium sp. 180]MCK1489753.1 protein kinase [Bradyrhizobium sp. 180]